MGESMTLGWPSLSSESFSPIGASSSQFSSHIQIPSLDLLPSSHPPIVSAIGTAISVQQVHSNNKLHQSPPFPLSDLPSWTILKAPEEDDSSSQHSFHSDHEHSAAAMSSNLHSMQLHHSTATTPVKDSAAPPALDVPKPSSHINGKAKKARFDGVFIVTRPPRSPSVSIPARRPSTDSTRLNLVDGLQHAFDANRHAHDVATFHSLKKKDVSAPPQTDAESGTEPEDELGHLHLNTLLAPARSPEKRRLTRNSATLKIGPSSAGATPVLQPAPARGRRTKSISYDGNAALVDAALGTRPAYVSLDGIPEFNIPAEAMDHVDDGEGGGEGGLVMTMKKAYRLNVLKTIRARPTLAVPMRRAVPSAVSTPYQSRHGKFRQRLNLLFGDDATVRVDKGARPRARFNDLTMPDASRPPSPSPSASSLASSVSANDTITGFESTTEPTSQSPGPLNPPSSQKVSAKRQLSQDLNEGDPANKKLKMEVDEKRMSEWILAVQRLVKGKVRVTEETLEGLSSVLAEIESVKDDLDTDKAMTTELFKSIRQLSQLQEIPFGDVNHLRRRAESLDHA